MYAEDLITDKLIYGGSDDSQQIVIFDVFLDMQGKERPDSFSSFFYVLYYRMENFKIELR